MISRCCSAHHNSLHLSLGAFWSLWPAIVILVIWVTTSQGMTAAQIQELRRETEEMFFHGFENYMTHAFPEDELRPISCKPLTRDRDNPAHIELNDALGNYSLTLVDSLSTLAILASSPQRSKKKNRALTYFQDGVKGLVEQYGDGSNGPRGQGKRGRGFDVDSKVQVFETVIRGVGGLLSAHLFAVGDLPIRDYSPPAKQVENAKAWDGEHHAKVRAGIVWPNKFTYNGQLLRLAYDLATRLLPAFYTATGIPYPRVNLRHGIPFYANSPLNFNAEEGECGLNPQSSPEITETCSAGAGSLVLEFTVLSRLTSDHRFEQLAKRAFWAIWDRRSEVGLVGAGIDAENGQWVGPFTGIGASVDSFFEYAFKSHILLSRSAGYNTTSYGQLKDPNDLFLPLTAEQNSVDAFLQAWDDAHASIKRNLYRGVNSQHPHYIQADLWTGAPRAFWIDSLSAYYPGLLALAGELEEAIETHLLMTALWTRFSALPERYNVASGTIEGGLGWWGGRPEFIESTYHLYRATEDPWYLHVGEMTLRDIKRRCWSKCGWAGLQDVRTGELNDRMESFFLGETAKYLFLLFDFDHPLNRLDAPFVFTTEGHPLVIPLHPAIDRHACRSREASSDVNSQSSLANPTVCPAPPKPLPFSVSHTAARGDIFHAAALARLHQMPSRDAPESSLVEYAHDHPSVSISDLQSPSNYTYYPWTLPPQLIPSNATCAPMAARPTFDLTFPPVSGTILGPGALQRVNKGIMIKSVGGMHLSMIQDAPLDLTDISSGGYRIQVINNLALGKDEKVYLSKDITSELNPADPNFTRVRDTGLLDIVVDIEVPNEPGNATSSHVEDLLPQSQTSSKLASALAWLIEHVSSIIRDDTFLPTSFFADLSAAGGTSLRRLFFPAITSTGVGAAPLPDWIEAPSIDPSGVYTGSLLWNKIYISDETCDSKLPLAIPKNHQVLVMKRGGCSFAEKLQNIPAYAPSSNSLQLVIIISMDPEEGMPEGWLVRPLLEEQQLTAAGLPRYNPIPMVMMAGGEQMMDVLTRTKGLGIKRRYVMQAQGIPISNLIIV